MKERTRAVVLPYQTDPDHNIDDCPLISTTTAMADNWRSKQQNPGRGRGGWRARGGAGNAGRGVPRTPQPAVERPAPQAHINDARRKMEYMASVSRSSGLEKDGDSLKDFRTQQEYRQFIQEKLNNVFTRHPWRVTETEDARKQRIEVQENVLILFRKLREGVSASRRKDVFALEVYQTSLFLAVIFASPKQTTSIIPHLVPTMFIESSEPASLVIITVLISLLHHLVTAYPSQGTYHQHLNSIPKHLFLKGSEAGVWIKDLATSLRAKNYAKFERLSRRSMVARFFEDNNSDMFAELQTFPVSQQASSNLAHRALLILVDSLRTKARDTSWSIMRAAYRELSCGAGSQDTKDWMCRSLYLQSLVTDDLDINAQEWLETQLLLGHVRRKEGFEDRWIVCKAR
ncbi:hypothetical protein BDQ12DRAFT_450289 [Crucibulum laeve]|uniref:Uncharacterized protein n=1 Tax=Crucibulum laeve TaxID=68775 RepID=A0A5C3LJY1_9AGAR|nr:hypothetical protein BDQ12DRAFT_450289 [Crucibulum laeve]